MCKYDKMCRQTDGQPETSIPPFNFVEARDIMMIKYDPYTLALYLAVSVYILLMTSQSIDYVITLKWKCCHFDEILITDCTESCHFDNFRCSQYENFVKMTFLFQCRNALCDATIVTQPHERWHLTPHIDFNRGHIHDRSCKNLEYILYAQLHCRFLAAMILSCLLVKLLWRFYWYTQSMKFQTKTKYITVLMIHKPILLTCQIIVTFLLVYSINETKTNYISLYDT